MSSTVVMILILDFGSQYTQLIARRVRELQVYCELFPWDVPQETIRTLDPAGIILSGGPSSVYEENAPTLQPFILASGLPVLGICYGMQLLTLALGGLVARFGEAGVARLGALLIAGEEFDENHLFHHGILAVVLGAMDHVDELVEFL